MGAINTIPLTPQKDRQMEQEGRAYRREAMEESEGKQEWKIEIQFLDNWHFSMLESKSKGEEKTLLMPAKSLCSFAGIYKSVMSCL